MRHVSPCMAVKSVVLASRVVSKGKCQVSVRSEPALKHVSMVQTAIQDETPSAPPSRQRLRREPCPTAAIQPTPPPAVARSPDLQFDAKPALWEDWDAQMMRSVEVGTGPTGSPSNLSHIKAPPLPFEPVSILPFALFAILPPLTLPLPCSVSIHTRFPRPCHSFHEPGARVTERTTSLPPPAILLQRNSP